MTRISKLVFAAAASMMAIGGTAFADDPPAEGAEAAAEGAGAAAGEAIPPVEGSTAMTGTWSMSIIDRPINLLKGMIRVDGDLGVLRISIPPIPPATTGVSGTGVSLRAGVGYGVSDKLEVGGSYALSLKEFEAKGPLSFYGLLSLKNETKLRISAGATATLNLAADNSFGIAMGLAFQYHLNDKIMVYMPPSHVQLGLNPDFSLAVNLPVGAAMQVTPNIFAFLETNLFNIGIEPSGSAFIFADQTPLTLGAFYSPSNKMDLGVSFGMPNVPDVADIFTLLFSARLYFGSVPSSGAAAMSSVDTSVPPPAM